MSISVTKVTGLEGKPLSLALQNVLRTAKVICTKRGTKEIDEDEILAALLSHGDKASELLRETGKVDAQTVYKQIGIGVQNKAASLKLNAPTASSRVLRRFLPSALVVAVKSVALKLLALVNKGDAACTTLHLRGDFGVMGGFYLRKAAQLAELTGDTEVRPEHLLFTSLVSNRTARVPTLVRDLGRLDHDPVEAIRDALGFDEYTHNLFKVTQEKSDAEWSDPRCII